MASKEEECYECSSEEKRYSYSDSGPLFYAYARRTDSSWASRYLLTFASAAVADEWWSLVQQEYPKVGVRSSPQLFSFEGDKFPQRTANDKNFEHLKTQWFYSQIGDSDGTGGRLQDIIPLQDWDGTVLTGGSSGSSSSGSGSGFGAAFQNALQAMQSLMEGNNSQIKTLIDIQSENNERFARMEQSVEENAGRIKTLSQGQSDNQDQMKELLKQNQEQLRTLANGQAASAEKLQETLEQSAKASADMVTELKKQQHQIKIQAATATRSDKRAECPHNVHPPPRKIDKPVVGYDYGQKSTIDGKAASAK